MTITPSRPVELVLLDVNETLVSLHPIAERMAEVGLDGWFELWFTRILRDGFAAAAAGRFAGFRDLAGHHLLELLRRQQLTATEAEVDHVLTGFHELVPYPDVAPGLTALRHAGVPAIALTNGSADLTRTVLDRAGLSDLVLGVHDVEEVGRWKPAAAPYRHVLEGRRIEPAAAAMIAVHPWDLLGAQSAGLIAAWLERDATVGYPTAFGSPDVSAPTLDELVHRVLADGPAPASEGGRA